MGKRSRNQNKENFMNVPIETVIKQTDCKVLRETLTAIAKHFPGTMILNVIVEDNSPAQTDFFIDLSSSNQRS